MIQSFITYPPDTDAYDHVIIALHGIRADEQAFLPFVRQLEFDRTIWILPSAPNGEGPDRWWFDFQRRDEEGVVLSRLAVGDLIGRQIAEGIPSENIFLMGFSQGAAMALEAGLKYPKRLGGIVALSGFIINPEALHSEIHASNSRTPVFLAHGTEDEILDIGIGRTNHKILTELGVNVDYHEYATEHRISIDETKDIRGFLYRHMYGMSEDDPRHADDAVSPF